MCFFFCFFVSVFRLFLSSVALPNNTPGDLLAGLSKFAKLARSVTRSKTLVSQFSSHPVSIKDSTRHVQSHLAHVSTHLVVITRWSPDKKDKAHFSEKWEYLAMRFISLPYHSMRSSMKKTKICLNATKQVLQSSMTKVKTVGSIPEPC